MAATGPVKVEVAAPLTVRVVPTFSAPVVVAEVPVALEKNKLVELAVRAKRLVVEAMPET